MSQRLGTRLGGSLWLASLLLLLTSVAFVVVDRGKERGEDDSAIGFLFLLEILAFATVGALIVARRPNNPIGWLLAGNGLAASIAVAADGYARHALFAAPGSLPAGTALAWVAESIIDSPAVTFGFFAFLFLLFPHGHLPSTRWRSALWLLLPVMVTLQMLVTLQPGALNAFPDTENPLSVSAAQRLEFLEVPLLLLLLAFIVASAVSLIQRFRAARGLERQQLKWVVAACAFVALTLASGPVWWSGLIPGSVSEIAWPLLSASALASIPIACGIAILRHRLYDIDRIINRTLVYGFLTAVLALTYFGLVVGLRELLRPLSGGSDLSVVVTTLVVAALFLPARRRVQDVVDRRFNRRAYDAARTVDAFAARLRQQIDLDTLRYELLTVVDETVQPSRAALWLRGREGAG